MKESQDRKVLSGLVSNHGNDALATIFREGNINFANQELTFEEFLQVVLMVGFTLSALRDSGQVFNFYQKSKVDIAKAGLLLYQSAGLEAAAELQRQIAETEVSHKTH